MGKRAWYLTLCIALGVAMVKCASWAAFRFETDPMIARGDYFLTARFATIATLAAATLLNRRIDAQHLLGWAPILGATAALAFAPLIHHVTGLLDLATFLHGVGFAILLLGWGSLSCSVAPRVSTLGVTAGFLAYSLIVSSIGFLNLEIVQTAKDVVAIVSPLVAGGLLLSLTKRGLSSADTSIYRPWGDMFFEQVRKVPAQPLIVLLICVLMTNIASAFVDGASLFYSSASILILLPLIYLLLFGALLVWFLALKQDSPLNLWPLLILLAFVVLLVFSSLSGYGFYLADSITRTVTFCTKLFFWFFVSAFVFSKRLSALLFFGPLYVFTSDSAMLTNAILQPILAPLDEATCSVVGAVLTLVMALVLIVLAFVMLTRQNRLRLEREESSKQLESLAENAAEGNPSQESPSIEALVGRFGLTSREAEVLQLVLKGYTWPMVADELCVSLNTAQSHQRNIYRKLGIHTKRELIEHCHQG